MNAIGIKANGAHATVQGGVIILTTRRHLNNLCFHVLGDDAHLLQRKVPVGEARQRRTGGNHQGRRPGNSSSGWRLRIGLDECAFFGCKKLQQPSGDRQFELLR